MPFIQFVLSTLSPRERSAKNSISFPALFRPPGNLKPQYSSINTGLFETLPDASQFRSRRFVPIPGYFGNENSAYPFFAPVASPPEGALFPQNSQISQQNPLPPLFPICISYIKNVHRAASTLQRFNFSTWRNLSPEFVSSPFYGFEV